MADAALVNQLQTALKCVQELRLKVTDVFHKLATGVQDADSKDFTTDLQASMGSVTQNMSELEKISFSVNPPCPALGSIAVLSMDPSTDKTPLYQQLIQGYRWMDKVRDRATTAVEILKRKRPSVSSAPYSSANKRPLRTLSRIQHPQPNPLEQIYLPQLQRAYQELNISYVPASANNPTLMLVTVDKTMQAILVMRGFIIERVIIKAIGEGAADASNKNIWKMSRHKVFQKLTDQAQSSLLGYQKNNATMPTLTMQSVMIWLKGYVNLFSVPCQKCGKILDSTFLPPLVRTAPTAVKSQQVVLHETCQL